MTKVHQITPREVTKADVEAHELVKQHLAHILSDAQARHIPIESIAQALCAAAGIGLSLVYQTPSAASRRALAKCVVGIRGSYRVATQGIEPRGGA